MHYASDPCLDAYAVIVIYTWIGLTQKQLYDLPIA